jgi:uncharacterized protein YndB with AHSA1/START domain
MTIAGDRVSVTVTVAVPADAAFEAFTQQIDLWWRKGVAYRASGPRSSVIAFEPRLDGRLFEEWSDAGELRVHEAGRVIIWDPPHRLAFSWRGTNFEAGESTLVDITFTPTVSGTRVDLVHSGLAALRPDHPARHGQPVEAFIRTIGVWWGQLLTGLRVHVA